MADQVDHAKRAAELAKRTEPFPVRPAGHPEKGMHVLYLGDNINGEVHVGGRVYNLNPSHLYLDSHDEVLAVGHASHPGRRGVPGWADPDEEQ